MTLWRFKSCPRCKGDLFIEKGMEGWYEQCLQCAHKHELKNVIEDKKVPVLTVSRRNKRGY